MKSPLIKSIGEVVTDYGARVMKVFKKGLLGRSLFDFYGDIKADTLRTNESSTVPGTPADGKGGVIYTKAADGKLYYKSNEVSEIELSANGGHTDEDIQDLVGAMFSSNTETNITVTYQDADGTIDLVATDTNTQLSSEEVQDIVGAMFTSNTETRISATYEDGDGTIDLVVDDMTADTNTQLSDEQVQDIVGGMVTGNTESGITVTYQDGDGTIDFEVGTLNQDTTGNAATATALETARNIGGVSFNGTGDINLPGVNTSGSQDTSGNAATATNLVASTSTAVGLGTIELGHASDTTIARSAAGTATIEGKEIVTVNKVRQQFNLTFVDDIGTTQHYLSWRDQYENSTSTGSDFQDTNYLVPANGRVVAVYLRVGNITATSDMTLRVYSQNAGFMQSQVSQEAEAVTITATADKFEVFAFYFDDAEHFQAGDLVLISVQNGTDAGGSQTYHVTAVLEFDYTQMGRTDSGELA
jgi:hypothetical protein